MIRANKTIARLLQVNAAGKISTEERLLLDRYLRVGQLIDLGQAKAFAFVIAMLLGMVLFELIERRRAAKPARVA